LHRSFFALNKQKRFMSSGVNSSATLLTDAWEQKSAAPAQSAVPQAEGSAIPRPSHQLMRPPYPPAMPPVQWVMPPQRSIAEPAIPQVDLVAEVNNLLTNTEQYLLRQISELHRASSGQFGKALNNHLNSIQNITNPPSVNSMLIAIIVLVVILIVGMIIIFCYFSKKLKSVPTSSMHGDLLNLGV
jgi:hypothetical protein